MTQKKNKIPAFTLFESVVAVTIIAVLIGLGSLIHANVVSSSQPVVYDLAQNEVDRLFYNLKNEKQWITETKDYEQFQIEQKITAYQGAKNLLLITYKAFNAHKILFTEKHLIAADFND